MLATRRLSTITISLTVACGGASRVMFPTEQANEHCFLAYSGGRFDEAMKVCRPACDASDDSTCAVVARMYEGGEGVPQDAARGLEFREKACKGGDLDSCEAAGITDPAFVVPAKAKICSAARVDDHSVGPLCRDAGLAYLDGIGVPVDRDKSKPLL